MIYDHYEQHENLVTRKRLNFRKAYNFWYGTLFERIMNIFTWEGLNFPQKEIEILLCMVGFCGITKFKKSKVLGAVYGSMSGVTNYPDEFTKFMYATPLESGLKNIGDNLVLVNNNQIRMPTAYVVDIYASLLAHTDLSLQAILINSRATGLAKARTQEQVDNIAKWYNALANGKTIAVLDAQDLNTLLGDKGIEVFSMAFPAGMSIDSYYQIRENLLKSFYSEIGINSMRDKRERVVEAELDTNLNRILFNVDDMLKCRQKSCDEINKMFGVKWSVDLNQEIVTQLEIKPEPETSDSDTESKKENNI